MTYTPKLSCCFEMAKEEARGYLLKNLAADLKRRCGTGGSVKDGVIMIQGDHRETLMAELKSRGFKAKIAGG
jgi:translation initiation factor 1 (eIF-1/SUI1)